LWLLRAALGLLLGLAVNLNSFMAKTQAFCYNSRNTIGGRIMSRIIEPDDVDLFVGGIEPDPEAVAEAKRFIEEYKNRPDYHIEAENAERLLAALGISFRDHGMKNTQALLDHWHRCVAELNESEPGHANGASSVQEHQGEDVCSAPNSLKDSPH
jgi:hypothetical protein